MAKKNKAKLKRSLRVKLLRHLRELGFVETDDGLFSPPGSEKETVRLLHRRHREDKILQEASFLKINAHKLFKFFADGADIVPEKIKPRLELINSETWQSDLFRLAGLTWSIPVSSGYGRRMRFLVWDEHNGKLMGLIALGDPVFNSRSRDTSIGWGPKDRKHRLANTLDAYVLGAVPPYNMLLGGKLVACLIKSKEVRDAFKKKYSDRKGIISKKKKNPALVLVTTSSALGRSAVYNRLKLEGEPYFTSVGFTAGWGHFHVPNSLFGEMREMLALLGHRYANGHEFGSGPNWRIRVIKEALRILGINPDILRHGINREVYISRLAANADAYLQGTENKPKFNNLLSVAEISERALVRWIIPRAANKPEFREWRKENTFAFLETAGLVRLERRKCTLPIVQPMQQPLKSQVPWEPTLQV